MRRPMRHLSLLSAAVVLLTAAECEPPVAPPTANEPASLEVMAGDSVTQQVGTTVELAVQVLNQNGDPVSGVTVNWSVSSGGGSLSAASVPSGTDGMSRVTWTLGPEAGAQQAAAAVQGLAPATFTAIATAGEIQQVEIAEDAEADALQDTVTLSAVAMDEHGNEYADATFTWAALDTTVVSLGGGKFLTEENGPARVTATLDTFVDTATITVKQALAGIRLTVEKDTVEVGTSIDMDVEAVDPNGVLFTEAGYEMLEQDLDTVPVTYAVSDSSKAVFMEEDEDMVRARGLGAVTVTANFLEYSDSEDLFFVLDPQRSIATGSSTTCALDETGQAHCWGYGRVGELGNSGTQHSATPVAVAGGHTFVEIAGSVTNFCGLEESGTVYCWGYNGLGGLGIGSSDADPHPTPQPVASGEEFIDIDGDWYSFCAVSESGDIYCWGLNEGGIMGADPATGPDQCVGFGGAPCATSPTLIASSETYTEVAVGYYHACAIEIYGDVSCWGRNAEGQFGNGMTSTTPEYSPVTGTTSINAVSIDANWSHTCAITASDEAYCWGYGPSRLGHGLGENATVIQPSPVEVAGGHAWSDISAANGYTCGTTTSAEAYCWGNNGVGRLGTGDWMSYPTPTAVVGGHNLATVSAGFGSVCALDASGKPFCWGSEDFGGLGNGEYPIETVPVAVNGGHNFTEISGRASHTCALDTSGAAWCWGANWRGQLGTGFNDPQADPAAVSGSYVFADISTANDFTCALTSAGAAYCWGGNYEGMLGDGTTTDSNTPVAVSGGHTFTDISAGWANACAVDDAGSAYCWGNNLAGQLGNGDTIPSSTPVAVSGTHQFTSVGTGDVHACGLTSAGEIYCWGSDDVGQLGTSAAETDARSTTPVLVDGGHTWASLSVANGYHTCAVTTGGDAYCWGLNNMGQLGDGTTTNATTPVLVQGSHTWDAVFAGGDHTCGVATDGTTYCWGANTEGELGEGHSIPVNSVVPVAVSGGYAFTELTASFGHTCGVTATDQAYCWGYENFGQLGINDLAFHNMPQSVLAGFTGPSSTMDPAIFAASRSGVVPGFGIEGPRLIAPETPDAPGAPAVRSNASAPVKMK